MDVETAGLSDYGKHGEYVGRQVKTWTRQYEASKTGEIPAMDKVRAEEIFDLHCCQVIIFRSLPGEFFLRYCQVIAWLPVNIPAQRRTSVVHGDFRVDNLIYDR